MNPLFLGLEMAWVHRPPEKIISGESFDVIYSVFASDYFYHYAVENGIFSHRLVFINKVEVIYASASGNI